MFSVTRTMGVVAFCTGSLLAAPGFGGSVPESSDPIKVILNDWTGQHFSTYVAGGLLEKMGYNIEYVSAGALPQHTGLAQGNLHFQTEGAPVQMCCVMADQTF